MWAGVYSSCPRSATMTEPIAVVTGMARARAMPPARARTTSSATSSAVMKFSKVLPYSCTATSRTSAVPRYANSSVYTVEATWSRPMRIPERNNSQRVSWGDAARSSHKAEAWVTVTSLRVPIPARMTEAITRCCTLTHDTLKLSSPAASSPSPPMRVPITDSQEIPVDRASPMSAPTRATEVRIENPCVR